MKTEIRYGIQTTAPEIEPFRRESKASQLYREAENILRNIQKARLLLKIGRLLPYTSDLEERKCLVAAKVHLERSARVTDRFLRDMLTAVDARISRLPVSIARRSVQFQAVTRSVNNSRVVSFDASTFSLDRHGTRVRPEGIDTGNYEQNPIFVWSHDAYGGPFAKPDIDNIIGRTIKLRKTPSALSVDVEFLAESINPRAEMALRMVRAKALNSVSIGFIPREVVVREEGGKEVPVIERCELLEISLVAIPSNPDALATSRN